MKIEESRKNHKGLFITFEGPDGSGKSSVINQLYRYLLKKYPNKVVRTREPGGTNNPIAEDIRNIILNKLDYKIIPITEAMLFAASRAQHIHDFIMPHLNNGEIVLCDRFVHSSLIYQGVARGLGQERVKKLNDQALEGLWPDLTFVLMVRPSVGLKRITKNNQREFNRLDREELSLHQKVYRGYKAMVKKYPKGIIVIDAEKPFDVVVKTIKRYINKKLKVYEK
ncbi:MAG: dTMP kinase [Mycoplasma sp.]|nr:dTMP kinase [Candidatus Hennigella equi]